MTITLPNIHPTAIVEDGAKVSDSCKIGPYCCIGPEVTLDHNVSLVSHVVSQEGHLSVEEQKSGSSSVGSEPQDLKYNGEKNHAYNWSE